MNQIDKIQALTKFCREKADVLEGIDNELGAYFEKIRYDSDFERIDSLINELRHQYHKIYIWNNGVRDICDNIDKIINP